MKDIINKLKKFDTWKFIPIKTLMKSLMPSKSYVIEIMTYDTRDKVIEKPFESLLKIYANEK